MPKKENYQKLKQVIQKANPEIMELKRGCEIMVVAEIYADKVLHLPFDFFNGTKEKDGGILYYEKGKSRLNGLKEDVRFEFFWTNGLREYYFVGSKNTGQHIQLKEYEIREYFKILGRPIRLADVLLALREINKANLKIMFKPKGLNNNGEFVEYCHQFDRWIFKAVWDLTKDLDDQSYETKQWLIKLLVK